jgi:hypothetical protein
MHQQSTSTTTTASNAVSGVPDTGAGIMGPAVLASVLILSGLGIGAYRRRASN